MSTDGNQNKPVIIKGNVKYIADVLLCERRLWFSNRYLYEGETIRKSRRSLCTNVNIHMGSDRVVQQPFHNRERGKSRPSLRRVSVQMMSVVEHVLGLVR